MGIKRDADEVFFARHPVQRELALRLDEAFEVTFGKMHGDLGIWLADPTIRTRERFGLQKEVLIIYSGFPTTDARVLTAIENISRSPDFKHRIDRVLVLVIHSGNPLEAEDLARSDPERVLVPISAQDLLDGSRGTTFIRSRLASTLGAVDLFGMSSPLTSDKYFFGRTELVQQLSRRAAAQRQNSGLFGLRKTGKTSVLYAVGRAYENQPVLFTYLDCQNPGIHGARWWDALSNIVFSLAGTLSSQRNKRVDIDTRYTQVTAGVRLVADLQAILKAGYLEQLVIALDEVEYITAGLSGKLGQHWDDDFLPFWSAVRAAHQELQGRFSFIVAGVNPTCLQKSHFGTTPNPIFQAAQPHYLEPLTTDAVRSMTRTLGRYAGLAFGEEVYPWLSDRFGGHPYLIRLATSEVWQANKPSSLDGPSTIRRAKFEALETRIHERLMQPIKDILLSLVWWYPEEYELLQILADGDTEFVRAYLKDKPDSLVQFAHYGLLSEGSGSFAIAEVRSFLREHGEEYKAEVSPFKRSNMRPELLPEVPDLKLLGQLFDKRTELEIRLRRAIVVLLGIRFEYDEEKVVKAMIKGLRQLPERSHPESLFSGRAAREAVHDFFILDMKEIITQNWQVFSALFENRKGRFEMNMDAVNRARRTDAHTKPVDALEAEEFNNSYLWLLGRLRKFEEAIGAPPI